jgi:hypothetical protein
MKHFNMHDCKTMKVPIHVGARINDEQCIKAHEEIEDMAHVPYASIVSILMYAMDYTRLDISHAVGILRKYM